MQSVELKQYVTVKNVKALKNVQNPDTVEDIDLLWVKDDRVVSLFEVEATTSMTSGLQRGSNVEASVPKFLVIPEERETQLLQKLKSPMFSERFTQDNWRVLYFEILGGAFSKQKGKTKIEDLIDKKLQKGGNNQKQLTLF